MVGIALLFDAETYLGSIRIFLKVLELGSISDAFVSGGIGGFAEEVPSAVGAGTEGVTTVTWHGGAICILLSSALGGQSGDAGIFEGRNRGALYCDAGCGRTGAGATIGVDMSVAWT